MAGFDDGIGAFLQGFASVFAPSLAQSVAQQREAKEREKDRADRAADRAEDRALQRELSQNQIAAQMALLNRRLEGEIELGDIQRQWDEHMLNKTQDYNWEMKQEEMLHDASQLTRRLRHERTEGDKARRYQTGEREAGQNFTAGQNRLERIQRGGVANREIGLRERELTQREREWQAGFLLKSVELNSQMAKDALNTALIVNADERQAAEFFVRSAESAARTAAEMGDNRTAAEFMNKVRAGVEALSNPSSGIDREALTRFMQASAEFSKNAMASGVSGGPNFGDAGAIAKFLATAPSPKDLFKPTATAAPSGEGATGGGGSAMANILLGTGVSEEAARAVARDKGEISVKIGGSTFALKPSDDPEYDAAFAEYAEANKQAIEEAFARFENNPILGTKAKSAKPEWKFNRFKDWAIRAARHYATSGWTGTMLPASVVAAEKSPEGKARLLQSGMATVMKELEKASKGKGSELLAPEAGYGETRNDDYIDVRDREARPPGGGWMWKDDRTGRVSAGPPKH